MSIISFPGLGISAFELSATAFTLGPLSVRWYAVAICLGLIVAFFVCDKLCSYFGIKENDFLDALLWAVPLGFVGARVGYILGDLSSFPDFMSMLAIWNGGLAIYGGIIGAVITLFVVCKIKKANYFAMLDIAAIGLLIGQSIGRWGNFFNAEVYGVATDLPWRMGILQNGSWGYYHPLFIYESLWNIVGLVLILAFMDHRKFNGEVFLWYTGWYGLGRALMEPLRVDEFQLKVFDLPINLVIAILAVVIAVGLLVYFRFFRVQVHINVTESLSISEMLQQKKKQKEQQETDSYESQFSTAFTEDAPDAALTDDEYVMKKVIDALDEKESEEEPNGDN